MVSNPRMALGVAGMAFLLVMAPAALATEVTLYGDLRLSGDVTDLDDNQSAGHNLQDNNTHLGIKVAHELDRVRVFGKYERFLDPDDRIEDLVPGGSLFLSGAVTREAYLGVSNETFGTLSVGRMANPFLRATRRVDPFFNTSLAGFDLLSGLGFGLEPGSTASTGSSLGGSFLGLSQELGGFGLQGNTIAYETPDLGGLTFNAQTYLNESAASNKHDFGFGFTYEEERIAGGVQYIRMRSESSNFAMTNPDLLNFGESLDNVRVWAELDLDVAEVSASYERNQGTFFEGDHFSSFLVTGTLPLTDDTRAALSVGGIDAPGIEFFDSWSVNVGLFHDVAPGFTAYAGVGFQDIEDVSGFDDEWTFAIGASYRFGYTMGGAGR